jgi:GTP-binding protein
VSIVVAILGRPNVGKSTLFNRLIGKRAAIVDDTPGVTRDRREGAARIGGFEFTAIDTAGLEDARDDSLEARMRAQTERALDAADVALLMIDARAGLTPLDRHFAAWLRAKGKPVIVVANKCESRAGEAGQIEAYALGLGEPVPISAEHGDGISDLLRALAPYAGQAVAGVTGDTVENAENGSAAEDEEGPLQLAIVGRPNVGKSTLVNRLLGEERVLTGPEAGITRDAIAVPWTWKGRRIQLVDTAGLRRRARVADRVEALSGQDAYRAVQFAQVVVLVLDGQNLLERQDLTIASQVVEEGRVLIVAVNKWDTVTDKRKARADLDQRLERSLPQIRGVPVVTLSALTGDGIERLLPAVFKAYDTWNHRVPTGQLNRWLEDALERHPPPITGRNRLRLRYMTQAKVRPPTFVVFTSKAGKLPDAYHRYLVNGLRDSFGLDGIPLRLHTRSGKNPYVKD